MQSKRVKNYALDNCEYHPDTSMMFSVALNESMHSSGDLQYQAWLVDEMQEQKCYFDHRSFKANIRFKQLAEQP